MPKMSQATIGATGDIALHVIWEMPAKEKEEFMTLAKKVCFNVKKLNVAYQTACTNGNYRQVHVVKAAGAFMKDLQNYEKNAQVKNSKVQLRKLKF